MNFDVGDGAAMYPSRSEWFMAGHPECYQNLRYCLFQKITPIAISLYFEPRGGLLP